jgi:hypothetical protein
LYNRKGVSTILGTLIFTAILFSAVIPMLLTMKQADIIMEQEKLELQRIDDEKSREAMEAYAYPKGTDKIEVLVESKCEFPILISHVWINDSMVEAFHIVNPVEEEIVGVFNVSLSPSSNSTFRVKLTTTRGNSYENLAGDFRYDGSDWMTETLGIFVIIDSEGGGFWGFGRYRCTVTNSTTYNEVEESSITFGSCSFFFDTTEAGAGQYPVKVEKKSGWFWGTWSTVYEEDVEINWPNGPPIIWVFTT